jgi:acyl dehydratase
MGCCPTLVSQSRTLLLTTSTMLLESPQALRQLIGRQIGVSEWMLLTQERIQQFAEVTDDRQWIHLDRERTRGESPYGTTVAHGFLTLSLLSSFLRQVLQIREGTHMSINYGLNRVRFPAPVLAGAKIRARFTLRSVEEVPGALEVVLDATVETEGSSKPCCVAEWVLRYYR